MEQPAKPASLGGSGAPRGDPGATVVPSSNSSGPALRRERLLTIITAAPLRKKSRIPAARARPPIGDARPGPKISLRARGGDGGGEGAATSSANWARPLPNPSKGARLPPVTV